MNVNEFVSILNVVVFSSGSGTSAQPNAEAPVPGGAMAGFPFNFPPPPFPSAPWLPMPPPPPFSEFLEKCTSVANTLSARHQCVCVYIYLHSLL